jgi:hypothetical protein
MKHQPGLLSKFLSTERRERFGRKQALLKIIFHRRGMFKISSLIH